MSEAHLNQGYTSYEDAVRYRRMREEASSRPVSSAQKNRIARASEEEHAHRKEHPMLEPDADTLNRMTNEQKIEIIEGVRGARAILEAARLGVQNTAEIESVTDEPEFIQGELPFER